MAFVEYQDVRYAAQAMATLQGSFLLSSDRGAIRIEYAKSKMAEVGFTNLWIEVGFTLCYDRPLRVVDAGAALRERSASSSSRSSLAGVVVCSYRARARRAEVTRGSPESKRRRDGSAQRRFFFRVRGVVCTLTRVFIARTSEELAYFRSPNTQGSRLHVSPRRGCVYLSLAHETPAHTCEALGGLGSISRLEPPLRGCDQRRYTQGCASKSTSRRRHFYFRSTLRLLLRSCVDIRHALNRRGPRFV